MRIALVVPGGVDRSGEKRVIPALLALIERIAARHDLQVFALAQEREPGRWRLAGADIFNAGGRLSVARTIFNIHREHARKKFDVVHSLWAGRSGLAGAIAARTLGVPFMTHLAGGELAAIPSIRYGGRLSFIWRTLNAWTLGRAARITAASAPIIALAAALGFEVQRVPLGVALDRWPALAPRSRAATEETRLIHVGSLNAVKDQATLLHAIRRLHAAGHVFRLDIAGEDTLRGAIQALALQLGLGEVVRFHGFLTQREVRPLFEAAHINLVTSMHEAGPLVLLEAAAAGVPTVGTAVGHVVEWAPEAALSVPIGDAAAFAGAVARLIADDALRLELAHAAMARAIAEDADFTARCFHADYLALASS